RHLLPRIRLHGANSLLRCVSVQDHVLPGPGSQPREPTPSDSPPPIPTQPDRPCRREPPVRLPQIMPDTGFVPGGQGVAGSNPDVPTGRRVFSNILMPPPEPTKSHSIVK